VKRARDGCGGDGEGKDVGYILHNTKCLEMEYAGQTEQETFAEDVLWV
jgi:hypothetical protein